MIKHARLTPRQREAVRANDEGSFKQRKALANVTIPEEGEQFHILLQCYVRRLAYDWQNRRGELWCEGSTDMWGAIALFEALDADVKLVQTYLNGAPDTAYQRRGSSWAAVGAPLNTVSPVSRAATTHFPFP